MKKRKLNFIFKVLIFIVIVGIITGIIDYTRLTSNELPIFAIKSYDKKSQTQTFRGFFYKTTREISISQDEDVSASKNIKFLVLTFKIPISVPKEQVLTEFTIETKEIPNCTEKATLYHYYYHNDTLQKIYTYCLDEINVVKNKKKTSLKDYLQIIKFLIN